MADISNKGLEAIAWLASSENRDEETRKAAKDILDKMYCLAHCESNKRKKEVRQ